eukprot:1580992-Rhodomonas_salina.10
MVSVPFSSVPSNPQPPSRSCSRSLAQRCRCRFRSNRRGRLTASAPVTASQLPSPAPCIPSEPLTPLPPGVFELDFGAPPPLASGRPAPPELPLLSFRAGCGGVTPAPAGGTSARFASGCPPPPAGFAPPLLPLRSRCWGGWSGGGWGGSGGRCVIEGRLGRSTCSERSRLAWQRRRAEAGRPAVQERMRPGMTWHLAEGTRIPAELSRMFVCVRPWPSLPAPSASVPAGSPNCVERRLDLRVPLASSPLSSSRRNCFSSSIVFICGGAMVGAAMMPSPLASTSCGSRIRCERSGTHRSCRELQPRKCTRARPEGPSIWATRAG